MSKPGTWPTTRTKHPEPSKGTVEWVIWAAWADRVTFEEIHEITGLTESEVIRIMRRNVKRNRFKRWRQRVSSQSIKHRKRFQRKREAELKKTFY